MYVILTVVARLFSFVPSRYLDSWASGLAFLFFDVFRLRRALVLKNLDIALGDVYELSERIDIGRESYKNFILTGFEFLRSKKHDIAAHVDVQGQHHIVEALKKNQGAYILCFHLGNWEAMGAHLTRRVAKVSVLVKRVGGKGVNRFVEELRLHNGFHWISRRKRGDGFKGIQEVLAKNELVGFVMDQARPGEPRLSFFGSPAKTNTSFAAIWRRQKAPIIPAYFHRKSPGHHVFEVQPELQLTCTSDEEKDILVHSVLFNKEAEKAIRKYPGHYFWLHDRWKA